MSPYSFQVPVPVLNAAESFLLLFVCCCFEIHNLSFPSYELGFCCDVSLCRRYIGTFTGSLIFYTYLTNFKLSMPNLVTCFTGSNYLSGLWLGAYMRMNTKKTCVQKSSDYVLKIYQNLLILIDIIT